MKAIAAMSENRVIGANGKIPWHISEDLQFFKRLTLGNIVVMGRKTFESLGRPLPNRENIVVSRRENFEGVRVVRDLANVPRHSSDGRTIFLIGGAELYRALLSECDELYLTIVHREVIGDAFFPELPPRFSHYEIELEGEGFEIRKYRNENVERGGSK